MMTFLVTGDFVLNAQLLDDQRLAKQRVEARQILDAIQKGTGWQHHPIVLMWKAFSDALKYYTNCIILEFIRRGGNNNLPLFEIPERFLLPWWSQWNRLHQSHRAMLMRKNPFYYTGKFTIEPEYYQYGYLWKVDYSDREAPLSQITAPIPKELINPIYCPAILKSGKRAGQSCTRLVKDKEPLCRIHRTKV